MYQGPPPQNYNDYIMQQELHQRLNYGPPPPQGPPAPPGGLSTSSSSSLSDE